MLLKLSQPIILDRYIDIGCNYRLKAPICCYGFPLEFALKNPDSYEMRMFGQEKEITDFKQSLIIHNASTSFGQSGSPLFIKQ
jgi:hypothetical protein